MIISVKKAILFCEEGRECSRSSLWIRVFALWITGLSALWITLAGLAVDYAADAAED